MTAGDPADGDVDAPSSPVVGARPEMDNAAIERAWREAMGVPIWPKELGAKVDNVELRELSVAFFDGWSAVDLNGLEMSTPTALFQVRVFGKRVLILRFERDPMP